MIFNLKFNLLIVHNHDRMHSTSTTQVLHTATWDYFISRLPYHFGCSPKAVKEAIMTDINDLVQVTDLLGCLSSQSVVYLEFCMGDLIFWKCVLILFPCDCRGLS